MMINIPICPECKKEILSGATLCHHCNKTFEASAFLPVFSWQWEERLFLFVSLLMGVSFFIPWFPGQFLLQDSPFSPFHLLMHIIDIEVGFLESYDYLRMLMMVPLFSFFVFGLVYFGDRLKISPFPGMFLILSILVSLIVFLFQHLAGGALWTVTGLCLILFLSGLYQGYKQGFLGRVSVYMLKIFLLISIFIYLSSLFSNFYIRLETSFSMETLGFYITWGLCFVLMIAAIFENMKTMMDFWLVLFAIGFSLMAWSTLVHPAFVSGPIKFFSDNLHDMSFQLVAHIRIVGISLIIAIITGVPIGVYITRHPGMAGIVLYISSILITIPSIAMFGFMMPILSSIDNAWDAVQGIGIGVVPAVVALALYSLLPIVRNTYIAVRNVDPATIEAGRGMGMTGFQLLIQLQLPLAAPIIMAGVRTAVVMGIAIAAIAAYIGAGGLGLFVSKGLQMSTNDSVIAGAIAMSTLAIVADLFLGKVEEWITPAGLKVKQASE